MIRNRKSSAGKGAKLSEKKQPETLTKEASKFGENGRLAIAEYVPEMENNTKQNQF